MRRAMTRSDDPLVPWLLDVEAWDSPGRLTDADLYVHAGAGWRRGVAVLDDPEDEE